MLPSRNRMRRGGDFTAAMRGGRRAGRAALSVAFLPPRATGPTTSEPASPLVGFVVSKAVGNAVVRHRVQRRLRHLMRARLEALPPGSLLVVRAKPQAATLGHNTLATQLDETLDTVLRPRRGTARRRQGAGRAGTAAREERAGNATDP